MKKYNYHLGLYNMAGRPPKSPDTIATLQEDDEFLKNKIRKYLVDNIDSMFEDINELPVKERAVYRQKLLDFVVAKVQSVKTTQSTNQSAGDFLLEQEAGLNDE